MTRIILDSFTGNYKFLSNFYPSPMRWAKHNYPTAEHLYQARKTGDFQWNRRIAAATTPSMAKALGRQAPLLSNWEDIKLNVMRDVVELKFRDNPELAERLLATGIEGNYWHDQFWGDCTCVTHRDSTGRNALGTILMNVRLDLQVQGC
jgi:ribA/ribD-fused uncharacterized protein